MKRFLILVAAFAMALSLFACGTPSETTEDTSKAPEQGGSSDVKELDEVGNGKHVVALLMNHEKTPEFSGAYGSWANAGKDLKHQPDKTTEEGLRDIASVYYPSIGLYDVTDPDYQEYVMQLCKMTYVDTLNYYIGNASELKDGAWWGDGYDSVISPMLEKYGISATARLEKPINSMASEEDTETIKKVFTDIVNKLGDNILKIDGRPVIAQFTVLGVEAETIDEWKTEYFAEYGAVPFFMLRESSSYFSDAWFDAVDGYFGWVELDESSLCQYETNYGDYARYATVEQAMVNHGVFLDRMNELIKQGKVSFYSESVTPSFDDLAVWGWGTTPRKIEGGDKNQLHEFKWQSAVSNKAQMVTIPTWDDWGEASTIEPTLQYGIDRLEITRKYAAEFKEIEANTASLELPGWIYKIRKTTNDQAILAVMDEASLLIAESRYDEAEALVKPYVTVLGIPQTSKERFDYPTTPTSPLAPQESDEGKTAQVSGDTETWTPSADTYVAITSTTNIDAGSEEKMRVKNAYATKLSRNAFIQFDTSATSFDGVSKATLKLYCVYASSDEAEIAGRDINLYATIADWHEGTFSWKTQPLVTEKIAEVDSSALVSKKWIEIDVTEYLKYNTGKKISFMLRNDGADTEENQVDFATKESGANSPQLIIVKGEATEQKPVVEPKETTLTALADTFVANDGALDGGSNTLVRTKKMDSAKRTRNAFIKFDTASLEGSDVFKATLKLYCSYASVKKELVQSRYLVAYATNADWQENSFTWSSQPEKLEKIVAYIDTTSYASNKWVEIDITEHLKAHAGEVISISICNEGSDNEEAHVDFASREQVDLAPQLVIIHG